MFRDHSKHHNGEKVDSPKHEMQLIFGRKKRLYLNVKAHRYDEYRGQGVNPITSLHN
jgi:hypothetical protein